MTIEMPRRGIDHLVLCVRDLDAARARYSKLGFTLTPAARHPFGTGNSLVQLQSSFLELLAVLDRSRIPPPQPGAFSFAEFNRRFLERREGLSMLVFESHDARRDQTEFANKGLPSYPPFDFSRNAQLPDGSQITVGFSLAFVTDPRLPQAAFFTCQQHAPQYFWKSEYQRHANGAAALTEVIMVAPEPQALIDLFGKLQSPEQVQQHPGRLHIATRRGDISVLTRSAWAARFPGMALPAPVDTAYFAGYGLTLATLDPLRQRLRAAAIQHVDAGDRIRIPPSELFGVMLEFRTAI